MIFRDSCTKKSSDRPKTENFGSDFGGRSNLSIFNNTNFTIFSISKTPILSAIMEFKRNRYYGKAQQILR